MRARRYVALTHHVEPFLGEEVVAVARLATPRPPPALGHVGL